MLQYLKDWETWVMENQTIPKKAKPYCLYTSKPDNRRDQNLWLETSLIKRLIFNLCFSSFMIQYLLSNDDVKFVLTERFNQDPVENLLCTAES